MSRYANQALSRALAAGVRASAIPWPVSPHAQEQEYTRLPRDTEEANHADHTQAAAMADARIRTLQRAMLVLVASALILLAILWPQPAVDLTPDWQSEGIPRLDRSALRPLVHIPRPANSTFKYELSIGSFFGQSDKAMLEWIEYHRMLGVEHFFLYEHELNPANTSRPRLQTYIDAGILELDAIAVPLGPKWRDKQGEVFRTLLRQSKNVTRWLMLIDSDEFVVPKFTNTIPELLRPYEAHAGLAINWQLFGTSRVKNFHAGDLLTERLQYRGEIAYGENAHIKSIVQPHRVSTCYIHHCVPIPPWEVVDSSFKPVTSFLRAPPLVDTVQLNHYFTRDESHFQRVKLVLRDDDSTASMRSRVNQWMAVHDTTIQRFVPALRERLFLGTDTIKLPPHSLPIYTEEEMNELVQRPQGQVVYTRP